CKQYNNWISF
nr:immunoglobulin light chain junction region [Macaca mulatta]